MSRHPRLDNLRVIDIDLLGAGSLAVGLGLGAWLAGFIGWWWWLLIAIGLVCLVRPFAQWFRPVTDRSPRRPT